MTVKGQMIRRFCSGLLVIAVILPALAGTVRFWQGWSFLVLAWGPAFLFALYAAKHDPGLLERRMRVMEKNPRQTLVKVLGTAILFSAMALSALDFRFGWSRTWPGAVPLWLVILGQAAVLAGIGLVIWTMKSNSFAGRTITVEAEQKVATTGPYAVVPHPMYAGVVLFILATPLALGSYVTLPMFLLVIPLLAFRLLDEEKVLRRDLAGYEEYCQHTRFRLLPGVW
jgi:protein-S-isoprenylcysteine O-methyltransferase Ste14